MSLAREALLVAAIVCAAASVRHAGRARDPGLRGVLWAAAAGALLCLAATA